MNPEITSSILCILVALAAAIHIPHAVHAFARQLCRWMKPLEKRPLAQRLFKATATGAGMLIIPAHFYFYIFEAWLKATHA